MTLKNPITDRLEPWARRLLDGFISDHVYYRVQDRLVYWVPEHGPYFEIKHTVWNIWMNRSQS